MLTTKEAGRVLGVKDSRVRQFIGQGRLVAVKRGRDLWLRESAVEEFRRQRERNPPKPGYPKGRPRKPREG